MSNPRVPYQMSTERKPLAALRGKPLMVHVVVNVEYWPLDQAMPRAVLPAPHGKSPIPDVGNFAWVEYGMRVGLPRLLRLITERGIAASTFMNAQCADVYGRAADAMLKAGWEFVGHGWTQRSLQFETDEAAVIAKSVERLEHLTGKKPRGWFGAGAGESFDTPISSRPPASIGWPTGSSMTCPAGCEPSTALSSPCRIRSNSTTFHSIWSNSNPPRRC